MLNNGLRRVLIAVSFITGVTALAISYVPAYAAPQLSINRTTVVDGVYTTDQASAGEKQYLNSCSECHGETLIGGSAPRLRTDAFVDRWREDRLESLFDFMKNVMPREDPRSLSDDTYLSILAYILRENSYPPGTTPLTIDALSNIQFIHKDGPKPLPNNSLVLVVGCLSQNPDKTWVLTNATEPVRNRRGNEVTPEELKTAESIPVGTQTFRLQNFETLETPFTPDPYKGHKMQVKGALFRQPNNTARIIVTSIAPAASECRQ
jgi:mono/diheme cytochrome c family protein